MPLLSTPNSQPTTLPPSASGYGGQGNHQLSTEWSVLETIPGLIALPGVWRQRFGAAFEPMKDLILQENPSLAQLLPCPRGCGLAHDIICRPDGSLVATCGADPNQPRDILLTPAEITPWEVSWSKLGHDLFEILELHGKPAPLPLPNTLQIGAWSADGVPVILTVQVCGATFRRVVAELVARLQRRFILLAPTSYHCDAPCQELLAHARAAFFPLETTVLLSDNRRLRTTRPPGELDGVQEDDEGGDRPGVQVRGFLDHEARGADREALRPAHCKAARIRFRPEGAAEDGQGRPLCQEEAGGRAG
jgi:hypothetical protein